MLRRVLVVLALIAVVFVVTAPARAQDAVNVADLLADPARYVEVTVIGELIGDYGERRDGQVWTQVNGDDYVTAPLLEDGVLAGANAGIGARIPGELVAGLDPPGGYRQRGPLVRLTGEWRYHDARRGGESYLQVRALTVLEPGRSLDEGVSWPAFGAGVALLGIAGAVGLRRRSV